MFNVREVGKYPQGYEVEKWLRTVPLKQSKKSSKTTSTSILRTSKFKHKGTTNFFNPLKKVYKQLENLFEDCYQFKERVKR